MLCASEAGPESQTQLGAALASHAIQGAAVALILVLAWRARRPHDSTRSVFQLVIALVLTTFGAIASYAGWLRLPPLPAAGVEAAVMATIVIAGRAIVRPPYAFGLIAFAAAASALLVGAPSGAVVGAMSDQLDHGWPTAWSFAGIALAGVLGAAGPGLALITAFVQPGRGAVWDHLHRRGA